MDLADIPTYIVAKVRDFFCVAVITPWLFYSPLSAQQQNKPTMELELGIGVKITDPLPYFLNDLTQGNISRGGFAESRLRFPGLGSIIRLRAAMDDWGQNIYSKDNQYRTDVWRVKGTVGLMENFSSYNTADIYWCLDAGINHWDINSTNPLFGKEKYNRIAGGIGLGLQSEHIFLEFVVEFHSMDNKGIKRVVFPVVPPGSPLPGLTTRTRNEKEISTGSSLSFVAGWKF